jgi:hypothetical protein
MVSLRPRFRHGERGEMGEQRFGVDRSNSRTPASAPPPEAECCKEDGEEDEGAKGNTGDGAT